MPDQVAFLAQIKLISVKSLQTNDFADPLDEATHEIERAAMRDTLILIGLAVALILKIVL